MEELLHYLELSVLISLVLIHLLDRYYLPRFSHGSLLAHMAMIYTYELTWKTTPNEPFPTTLSALYVKLVYKESRLASFIISLMGFLPASVSFALLFLSIGV